MILCMLLERPGEVVFREELRELLWPDNTFVEYEDSLNTAVRKLRAALSDSSDLPRYIETVAGQGYRFIAPVEAVLAKATKTAGVKEVSRDGVASERVGADALVPPPPTGAAVASPTWRMKSLLGFSSVFGLLPAASR